MNESVAREIFDRLMTRLPIIWDGKDSIRFMKDVGCSQWRQMEWAGFYFESMCGNILSENRFFSIPGKRYGNVTFDGFREINFDFKAHSHFLGSTSKVPTNGYVEVSQAIREYGEVGFIVACGEVEFDDHLQSFKQWHDEYKGKTSDYEHERIRRGAPSRRRKTIFILREIIVLVVDERTLPFTGSFQGGMRNSDGSLRNPKVMIDLDDPRFERYIFEVV